MGDKKDALKQILAGTFFFTGIIMIVVVILVVGLDKGLTQPRFQVEVLFRNVGGLNVGAPTRLSGVSVGYVRRIDFLEQEVGGRGVKVTLNIYNKYRKQLEKSTRFLITNEGILGQKLISIRRDEGGNRMDLSQPIIGEDPLDVDDSAEIFIKTAESLQETSRSIKELVERMEIISHKSTRLLDRIEQRIIEGNLFKLF